MLINPYQPGVVFRNHPTLCGEISEYYDRLYDTVPSEDLLTMSMRYQLEHGIKLGFRDIFYYIDLLYDNNPKSIIDVGCGDCIWKKWFPNIIGFDKEPSKWSKADFVDFFDEKFSNNHSKNWDCGMALNSLHNADWSQIRQQIDFAMNIVKDQFLFTFNFYVFNNRPDLPMKQLIVLFDQTLHDTDYTIKLLDYPILREIDEIAVDHWKHINGHVRFILQHKQ